MPTVLTLKGVSRNTASGAKTEAISSTAPRSHPRPNVFSSSRYASAMAPNIREIWNRRSGRMVDGSSRGSLPRLSQLSRTVHRRMNDDEAHPRHHRRPGLLRAAARGAGPRDDGGRRDDDHRSGGRFELQHDERRVRAGP